ncbi:hypothetical protein PUNSTDRAFT_67138 [Punctularia strigosozonata HHB-11173 SS5]|uniref:uncharacterized protein n=1 Tax=Punctularia strigosozonata (strain HHB-11173) TaxID=741275 RepID=UPI0004416920|nr:uncharacterized protein PUNSTDRAFT_67138 [Punctularia strigosozonata HHB-11173 SS5]EIN09938.1 hypothetical protein PUNSTDRAFT_67138 [Punctularia strigosozonata HHB-11173 SS5]
MTIHCIGHRDSHEGNKPHICHYEFCGKAFVRKHDLTRHIKGKHTDDRPFECDTCHKTYSRKDELNQHR